MVAEAWILKMRNQVSANIKQALLLETSSTSRKHGPKRKDNKKVTIGILSFEVANVMSKTIHLYKSLSESEITKLRNEILNLEGVRNLVSSEEDYLFELVRAEKLDELNRVAGVVSRLGKKCSVPALQGFEHVYGDIVSGVIDVKELGFLVKHMEGMVRKMDRFVSATRSLYSKMGVLNELEQTVKKFQENNQNEESRRGFEQKLVWQKQDVRQLKEISLWNQTFDKVVELLARTVCTMYARICMIFADSTAKKYNLGLGNCEGSPLVRNECGSASGLINVDVNLDKLKRNHSKKNGFHLSSIGGNGTGSSRPHIDMKRGDLAYVHLEDFVFPCGTSPGRLFMECLSLSRSVSKFDDDDVVIDREDQYSCVSSSQSPIGNVNIVKKREHSCSTIGPNNGSAVVYAPPSTLGGCALALHYANIIIVIEKLLSFPHLIGEEARDELYKMLPTSLRLSLKTKLKTYVKNLAIYDAPLAHDWKATLDRILRWLSPLAHNMMKWQSERNFEQREIVSRTNVLLFQTLYFADKVKTEEAICELLIGLNYICRYEQQQNALLGCASSFNFEDCTKWKLQCGTSLID
ncbi:protein PSK SIMULATOR [Trifolium repens]|nr:protein PSK SIMULATOR [Trifolium repens]